jgi:hypothetical protein
MENISAVNFRIYWIVLSNALHEDMYGFLRVP